MASVLYGMDADIPHDRSEAAQAEHFRRLGEIAHLMVDAGLIVVVSTAAARGSEVDALRRAVGSERLLLVWVGDPVPEDLTPDFEIGDLSVTKAVERLSPFMGSESSARRSQKP